MQLSKQIFTRIQLRVDCSLFRWFYAEYLKKYLKITSISVFHQNAELICLEVEERSFIFDNSWNVDRGQKTNLVKSTIFLLLTQTIESNCFQGKEFLCINFLDSFHLSKTACTQFLDNWELFDVKLLVLLHVILWKKIWQS